MFRVKHDAHEKRRVRLLAVLLGVHDVRTVICQETGDRGHDAGPIGADDRKDRVQRHARLLGRNPADDRRIIVSRTRGY